MKDPVAAVEMLRGPFVEAVHRVHAVVADRAGIVAAWGDPNHLYLPRSSCKMILALPMAESGAAAALTDQQLALACSSHSASALHRQAVEGWLADLGLSGDVLRCGPQEPEDIAERDRLIRAGDAPAAVHNPCSGKHCGFLAHALHLGAPVDGYLDRVHPVQAEARAALEELTGVESPGHAIDGCSAPNFATTVGGMARALAFYATAGESDARQRAAARLTRAMMAHPEIIHGEGSYDTELMRALPGEVALKRGADGCQIAILPRRGLGIALKCADGSKPGAEAAMTAILVALGVIDADAPAARAWTDRPILSLAGETAGKRQIVSGFPGAVPQPAKSPRA